MDEHINTNYNRAQSLYREGIENTAHSLQYFDDLLNCNISEFIIKAGRDWKNFDVDAAMDFFISNN
ncbi:MAG TPA: hypothetical protein PLN01_07490, partial [Spirochaetota bacterium]|nr:hypothetical protein [Spirochaetota bacterium]